jgi:hypothetical protein
MSRLPNHTELNWAIRSINDESLCAVQHHFLFLANSYSNKSFHFSVSYEELAKSMRRNRSTLIRKINLLVKSGYLFVVTKGNIRTMQANEYRLNVNKILANIDPVLYRKIFKPDKTNANNKLYINSQPSGTTPLDLVAQSALPSGTVPPKAYTEAIGPKTAAVAPFGQESEEQRVTVNPFDAWRRNLM